MNKQDLKTGDIVVLRNYNLGVVILEKDIILYQYSGYDDLDMFNDDLTSSDDDVRFDIMQVYRGYHNSPVSFISYEDEELVYTRDLDFKPITQTNEAIYENPIVKNNDDLLVVIMQAMYGNRTEIHLKEEDIDYYILGYLTKDLPITEPFDRTIIRIPNSNCVIVYNKYQEVKVLNRKDETHHPKPLASIPELNITLYSRCLMCRIDDNGKLQSIKNEDIEFINKYLIK